MTLILNNRVLFLEKFDDVQMKEYPSSAQIVVIRYKSNVIGGEFPRITQTILEGDVPTVSKAMDCIIEGIMHEDLFVDLRKYAKSVTQINLDETKPDGGTEI